jgi:ribosomal protein S18 acetylase RimI-like enzyme
MRDANFSIVRRMRRRALFVSLHDPLESPVAVGSFVCRGRWRCFGNLATRSDARRRGWGSWILRILAAHSTAGIDYDVLQVDGENPAISLYREHGFHVAYPYHYRRESPQRAESVSDLFAALRGA